ncbi:MAG TPA: hypothetical protein VLI40_09245, partial [Gemmatimonadaceae bacterium]|nr:hypothetical protein [Gemmatimonadaceae bacterium]
MHPRNALAKHTREARPALYLPRMESGRDGAALPQWRALCNDDEIGRAHYLDAAMALARIHAGATLDWAGDIATMGSVARLPDGRVYRVEPSGPRELAK